ncbi:MAG: histidine--tRNA ligase [Planctomycetes bacterium]|nr:histidine--tRNA ligase [Planctomycetota bacterium]
MKIQSVKGTRDFYPPVMAVRNFILDGWKSASLRNGFEEYDGPIFEYLKMYQVKSGDEIVEQLFNFTDRGGRHLAIRPEITPTLARMVNQQINSLPRPIKWFSIPRLCRAERPQKGRLREFFQWNVDIIGSESILADAEVIYCTIDYLRSLGLTSKDIKAKISSRKLLAAFLLDIGIAADSLESLYPILDKKPKLPEDAFVEMLGKAVEDDGKADTIKKFMELSDISEIAGLFNPGEEAKAALQELSDLMDILGQMSVGDYCVFDPHIVRGLAYYTGIVFEIHDAANSLRAVAGGGRYDNLLGDFGGPKVSGTGMGMGDCVLEILLSEKGLLDGQLPTKNLDYFIACLDTDLQGAALELTAALRHAGFATDFSYKATGLKKQLKQASAANSAICVIIGTEYKEKSLFLVKDMKTSGQQLMTKEQVIQAAK